MPALCPSLPGQEGEWRGSGRAMAHGLASIPEQRESRMGGTAKRQPETGLVLKAKPENNRGACVPALIKSAPIHTKRRAGKTPESHVLKVDERLRLARARREEQQKQLASRELGWLEREERARRYYEKQLEERRGRLEEQRQREARRRMAVEEKRQQRLKEDKERYESTLRRTMERSQKAQQRPGHCSRRGPSRSSVNSSAMRRCPLSQWETNLVIRLQTPTVSYLARSKSASCLSRDAVSSTPAPKSVMRCGPVPSSGPRTSSHQRGSRMHKMEPVSQGPRERRTWKETLSQSTTAKVGHKPPTNQLNITASSPQGPLSRPPVRRPMSKPVVLPSLTEEEDPVVGHTLSSSSQPVESVPHCAEEDLPPTSNPDIPPPPTTAPSSQNLNRPSLIPPTALGRPSAGTTDPEEATRLLAEKRRQAREQREREEERCRQREETERRGREELARRRAEERARLEAEAQRLTEERKRREDEGQKRAEEENDRRQSEEEQRLQQQREEEEARQTAMMEQQRLDRERHFQREEAERLERKKRLEEIMKRTRKLGPTERKSPSSCGPVIDTQSNENLEPLQNGTHPSCTKAPILGLCEDEVLVPAVAFKDRRSLCTLSGLDEIQAHQRTEVI